MFHGTLLDIKKRIDGLKTKTSCSSPVTNFFYNEETVDEQAVYPYFFDDHTLFFFQPFHDRYYKLSFFSSSKAELERSLINLLKSNPVNAFKSPLFVSIVDNESNGSELAAIFEKSGFKLSKKLARMRPIIKKESKFLENHTQVYVELGAEEQKRSKSILLPEFARQGDSKEILELLATEFDYCGDNLPEVSQIEEDISKKFVVVVRDKGKIVALQYFRIKGLALYGWYDIVKKDYRKRMLFPSIVEFVNNHIYSHYKIRRWYSWRDVNNKKLMRHARLTGTEPDGVYIFNLFLDSVEKQNLGSNSMRQGGVL